MDIPPSPYPSGQPPADVPAPPDYVPAYPWGIPTQTLNQEASALPPEDPRIVGRGKGRAKGVAVGNWLMAPPASHISRFMYDPNEMQLFVVFKGPDGKGEVAEYVYHFPTPSQGQTVLDRLRIASHPYGGVLKPDVIDRAVAYTCIFRD